jgi:hypothetical protein
MEYKKLISQYTFINITYKVGNHSSLLHVNCPVHFHNQRRPCSYSQSHSQSHYSHGENLRCILFCISALASSLAIFIIVSLRDA